MAIFVCFVWRLFITVLRSFVYQVHKLVKLRRDDYLRAAVALPAYGRVVAHEWVELATSASGETLWGNVEMID